MTNQNNKWVTIQEACTLTKKSDSTIRRYTKSVDDDLERVRFVNDSKGRGYYELNTDFLCDYFDLHTTTQADRQETSQEPSQATNQQNVGDNSVNNEKSETSTPKPEHHLVAQTQNILSQVLAKEEKRTPLHRHSTVWTAIIAVVIIGAIIGAGYLYKNEINKQNDKVVTLLQTQHQQQIDLERKVSAAEKKTIEVQLNESKNYNSTLLAQVTELKAKNTILEKEKQKKDIAKQNNTVEYLNN